MMLLQDKGLGGSSCLRHAAGGVVECISEGLLRSAVMR